MSYLLAGVPVADITSIGCHTNLWDFQRNDYHEWLGKEGLLDKMAPLVASNEVMPAVFPGNNYSIGAGLHDSSAALIPYLVNFHEPFILISTGTWCISMNPFNHSPLTEAELAQDCLCYMTFQRNPVKASRLFAGYEHEQQVKRIGEYFNQPSIRYRSVDYDPAIMAKLRGQKQQLRKGKGITAFGDRDLSAFSSDIEAYHQLMLDIADAQFASTQLVLQGTKVKRIFVDGGFSKNSIYMNMLALMFPEMEIFAASMAQATAMGAALAIHHHWNRKALPNDLIELKYYAMAHNAAI
ncbi:hypothetical protein MKQ70_10305 [Chitinophaga sedimenti]|uniref:FGGY-family carbohydrate kinase n=1 Tax=Chitinophaga sedimenti TaxID=2033606 RepID=UPI0020046B71|nr:FGGY-family carbohydrate kinase [Chitinophaga sedimenti]MCK7555373.1 hypothetical protein [Chitinophaga sedimenti]